MSEMPEGNRQKPTPEQPDTDEDGRQQSQEELAAIVGAKESRKVKARQESYKSVWFGLGMFGMIGWSVVVPALAFVALGIWIDRRWPSQYSWTLMLLFVGVFLGCFNAWYWVSRERRKFE